MVGKGLPATEMVFGIYNLWFLMQWICWSTDLRAYTLNFCRLDKDTHGVRRSGRKKDEDRPGSVYFPTRLGYFWPFASQREDRVRASGPIMPVEGLAPNCDFHHSEMPLKAGYWKRIMDPGNVQELNAWLMAIDQNAMGHKLNPDKTELYFANTHSASKGYPPNATALGYPKLCLDLTGSSSDPGLQNDEEEEFLEGEQCKSQRYPGPEDSDDGSGDEDEATGLTREIKGVSFWQDSAYGPLGEFYPFRADCSESEADSFEED